MLSSMQGRAKAKVVCFVLIIALCVTLIPIISFADIAAKRDVGDKITITSFTVKDKDGHVVTGDEEYEIGSSFKLDVNFTIDKTALAEKYIKEGDFFDIIVPKYLGVSGTIAPKDLIDIRTDGKLGEYSLIKLSTEDFYRIRVVFTDFEQNYTEANGGLTLEVIAKEITGEEDSEFEFKDETYPGPVIIDKEYEKITTHKVKKVGNENEDGTFTWSMDINMDSYIDVLEGRGTSVKEDVVIIDELMDGLYYKGDNIKLKIPYYIVNSDGSVTSTDFYSDLLYLTKVTHDGEMDWEEFQDVVKEEAESGKGAYGYFKDSSGKLTKLIIALGTIPGEIKIPTNWDRLEDELNDVKSLSESKKQATLRAYTDYYNGNNYADLIGFTFSVNTYVESSVSLDIQNSVIFKYTSGSSTSTSGGFEYEHKNSGWIATRLPGKVTIDKYDADASTDNNAVMIAGAKFKLMIWNELKNQFEDFDLGAAQTTSAKGSVMFDNLLPGKYKIVETAYAPGYISGSLDIVQILFDDNGNQIGEKPVEKDSTDPAGYIFEVDAKEIDLGVVFEAKNSQEKGAVQIIKEDSTNGARLEGAVFELYRKSVGGSTYTSLNRFATTNALGVATFSGLVWNDYQIKEVSWPKDYVEGQVTIDNDGKFTISGSSIKTVTINAENDREKGKVNLTKLDFDTKASMAGIDFYLQKLVGENPDEWVTVTDSATGAPYMVTTDENGYASWENLEWGTYKVSEAAFMPGYEKELFHEGKYKDNEDFRFELTQGALTINFIAENKHERGKIDLTKYGETKTEVLSGASFVLEKYDNSTWAAIGDAKLTDEGGKVSWGDLAWGKYRIVEKASIKGYLNSLVLKDPDGNVVENEFEITSTSLSFGVDGYNERENGSISLEKYSESGKDLKISGAAFQLWKHDGTTWTAIDDPKITGADGKVFWDELEWGTYGITETKSGFAHTNGLKWVSGYGAKNEIDGIQTLIVTSTALNLTLEAENPTVPGKVIIKKYALGDTEKNPLNGTEFYLLKKNSAGNYVTVTDSEGKTLTATVTNGQAVFENLEWGDYQLKENIAAPGYNKDTFEFPNEGKFTIGLNNVTTDGAVALVTLEGTNDTQKGKVVLTKTDGSAESDNNLIVGAKFQLWKYDEANSTWSAIAGPTATAANGTVTFDQLEWGSYWLTETSPAPGYTANSTWSQTPSGTPGDTLQQFKIGKVDNNIVLSVTKGAVNSRRDGELILTKVDENDDNTKIDGTVFELYKLEKNPDNEVFIASKSSIDGVVSFAGLEWGDYKLYETKSAEDYTTESVVFLPDDANTVITSDGAFTIDKDKIELKVKATNARRLGTVTLEKYDTEGNPLDGAVFGLIDEQDKTYATQASINGKITFENILWGKYKLVEITATVGYDKDNVTITPDGFDLDSDGYFTVGKGTRQFKLIAENPRLDGKVTLEKIDKTNKEKLNGVEFTLLDSDNKVVGTETTSNGQIEFTGLEWGDYKLVETKVHEGYTTSGMIFTGSGITADGTFTVTANALSFNVTADNKREGGEIELTKVDSETKATINGAKFDLLKDGVVVNTGTVVNGTLKFDGLAWGNYQLVETQASDSYTTSGMIFTGSGISNDGKFTVNGESLKFEVIAENPRLKGKIDLEKIDKTNKNKLDGVEFTLLDSKGDIVKKETTENGSVSFDNLDWGKYKLVETEVLEGYTTSGMVFTGEGMEDDGTFTITNGALSFKAVADNPRLDGEVELTKRDAKNSKSLIDGAEFNLLQNNQVVATGVSIDGKVSFDKLAWGDYQLVETKAAPGYDKTEITYEGDDISADGKFTVTGTALKFTVNADNGRLLGKLAIDKYDPVNNAKLTDTAFYLQYNDDDSWKTLTNTDGTTKYGITDQNGAFTFEDLEWGQYKLIEHKAYEGYDKDKVVYEGDVASDGSFYVTSNAIDLSVSAENERLLGSLKIFKHDSLTTNGALEGAVFFLRYMDENSATFVDYVDASGTTVTAVTDANGEAVFTDLPWGTYQVVEQTAPEGYQEGSLRFVDGSDGTYEISNSMRSLEVEATNDRILGNIDLEKTDDLDITKKLRGGEFTLESYDEAAKAWLPYTDEYGLNVIEITNSEGKLQFKNLPWGKYRIIELVAPEGYDEASLEFVNGTNEVTVGAEEQSYYLTATNTTVLGEEYPPEDGGSSTGSVLGEEAQTGDLSNLIPLLLMILMTCMVLLVITLKNERRRQEEC